MHLDQNSGNPIGISVCQLIIRNGQRVTAVGAYLSQKPSNLTIKTEAAVTETFFKDNKGVGLESDGI